VVLNDKYCKRQIRNYYYCGFIVITEDYQLSVNFIQYIAIWEINVTKIMSNLGELNKEKSVLAIILEFELGGKKCKCSTEI
jgi:hypothetical protein